MPQASLFTATLFVAIVAVLAAIFVRAAVKTAPAGKRWSVPATVLAFWLVLPAVLALNGALDRYAPLPTPGVILFAALTIATVVLAFSGFGARLAAGVSLAALVGFQAFRIPLELALHALYSEGVIPIQMTYSGRNFDIVTGVLAVVLALLLRSGRAPRWLVAGWNVLGLALLVNVLAVAILSTPAPFRSFMNEPPNLLPGSFPFVWLPTFLVQAALFGHLLVFRKLAATATARGALQS
jgi:hypothetical protein